MSLPSFLGSFQRLKGRQCDCPVPCEIISFKPVLSYAAFPSNQYVVRLNELSEGNVSEDALKVLHDYIRYYFVITKQTGKKLTTSSKL